MAISTSSKLVTVDNLKEFKSKYTEVYVGDLKKKVTDINGVNPGDPGYVDTEGLATVKEYVDNAINKGGSGSVVTIKEISTGLASDILKSYEFYQGDASVASNKIGTINLAKDLVVTSGEVVDIAANTVEKTPETSLGAGDQTYYAEGTYIKLTIANQTEPIYIDVKDLCDIYTAKSSVDVANDGDEVQVAISGTNEVSATLVDGTIAKSKLVTALSDEITAATTSIGKATVPATDPDGIPGSGDETFEIPGTGIIKRLEDLEAISSATDAEIDALFV